MKNLRKKVKRMLNELTEYRQYTAKPSVNGAFRLSYKNLTNKCSGLDRAMTVIARKFLFEDGFYVKQSLSRTEKAEAVKEVLKAWCGFSYEVKDAFSEKGQTELENIKNWFPQYVLCLLRSKLDDSEREALLANFEERVETCTDLAKAEQYCKDLMSEARKRKKEINAEAPAGEVSSKKNNSPAKDTLNRLNKLTEVLHQMEWRKNSFSKPLFEEEMQRDTADNDAKAITYESVIANAFHEGPLRNRVLEVPTKGFSFYKYSEKKEKYVPVKPNSTDEDLILKLIAVCLIRRQAAPAGDREFEVINKADVSNWGKNDSLLETKELDLFYADDAGERKIFRTLLIGGNTLKIAIDAGVRESFAVLDAKEAEEAENGRPEKKILWDYGSGRTFSEYPDH